MVTIFLQPDGSLEAFTAVPPQAAPNVAETPPAPNWNALFAESGLDLKRFEPEPPVWTSWMPFDASMGWKGSYAQDPTTTIHVTAAAFRGRPVFFWVIGPWTPADRDVPFRVSQLEFAEALSAGITLTLLAVGVLMLWRNLKQGRSDLRAALRLAGFVLAAQIFFWLCHAHHQSTFAAEWALFVVALGMGLWTTFLAWVAYVALEPFVRRRMPELLTSWTRLISGGWRDPLVGRHVLIGVMAGLGYVVVCNASTALLLSLNSRLQPPHPSDSVLLASLPAAISGIPRHAAISTIIDLGVIFVLFLVRTMTKRRWVAEIAVVILFAPARFFDDGVVFAIIWAASLALLCRVGLLVLVAFDEVRMIQWFPITVHPSQWYFGQSMVGVALCVGLAVYGFYTSLGGKAVFGGGRGILSFSKE
jgi:hypothetical protein